MGGLCAVRCLQHLSELVFWPDCQKSNLNSKQRKVTLFSWRKQANLKIKKLKDYVSFKKGRFLFHKTAVIRAAC